MSRSIANALREAGNRLQAEAEAHRREIEKARGANSLPAEDDRTCFLDAARGILAIDPQLRERVGSRVRSKLINKRINTPSEKEEVLKAVWDSVVHTTDDQGQRALGNDNKAATIAGLRTLMAYLIAKGLTSTCDRYALLRAAAFLHTTRREIETINRQDSGSKRSHESASDEALVNWAKNEAADWRKKSPGVKRAAGERRLFKLVKKDRDYATRWHNVMSSQSDHRVGGTAQAARGLLPTTLRRRRRADLLWA